MGTQLVKLVLLSIGQIIGGSMDGKIILLSALFLVSYSQAAVFKCEIDGKVIFSQDPCAAESEELDLSNVGSVVSRQESTGAENLSGLRDDIDSYVKGQDIQRQIDKLEHDRRQVFRDRDQRIKQLQHSRNYAANNLAGANWEQSLAQEMAAISQAADSRVTSIDREIAALRQRLDNL